FISIFQIKIKTPSSKLPILQPQEQGLIRPLFFGVCLGFMPCMITVWALGIAATTASVLHGSLIMLLLVVMTTPALWIATRLPKIIGSIQRFMFLKRLAPLFICMSGCWLILVGLSGLGILEHQHLHFSIFGTHYMIMFF
ncbi:MAG: sulfite exporter TauE/SafE family protein, partial [Myxococcaceae bacterium]